MKTLMLALLMLRPLGNITDKATAIVLKCQED